MTTGLLADALGILVVAAVFAVVIVSRRPRAGRRVQAAGTARPSPALPQPAAEGRAQANFVPVAERAPYDGGPLIGGPS